MNGFVAVTDPGWYENLSREERPVEANFWRPSARPFKLAVGTPFFFKLKGPFHAIAGFGYFAGFSVLPDWLAWDTFGVANGVPSLELLQERLERVQRSARIEANAAGLIGCCLIAEVHLFSEDLWIKPPADWSPRIQTGTATDLSRGEGLRIWTECLERVGAVLRTPPLLSTANGVRELPGDRYGSPLLRLPRLGQGIFRVQVLDAYGRACAVTGEHSLPVLDSAHIRPFELGGENDVTNGLALRTDFHRLFDRGYVSVDADYRLVVSRRLREDFDNGRYYYGLHGQRLGLPENTVLSPSETALAWHRESTFLG